MDAVELLVPFNRLLESAAQPALVREIEAGASAAPLWSAFEVSGFLNALVSQDDGGAGLSLGETAPLFQALGRFAVPVPVAETMVARALLSAAGIERPDGPIVLATAAKGATQAVPMALAAEHVLVETDGMVTLASMGAAERTPTSVHHDGAAFLMWQRAAQGPILAAPACGLRAVCAVLRSAAIAGAGDHVLQMTIDYANTRTQFGKPIGKQQAIQQQLAVMAEHAVAARIASQIGCAGGLPPGLQAAAVAKIVTSTAAVRIAEIAHAVHGAIGISAEYDLQLFSRRLHEWRLADGSESYWSGVLGAARLDANAIPSIDFVRAIGVVPDRTATAT